jgi:hypothetical protein
MYKECRHIKTNGLKCESPALRGKPYCYFHTRLHNLARAPKPAADEPIKLPVLEDSSTIQFALAQVLDGLGSSRLDPRRAGLLLFALQIASQHVQRNPFVYKGNVVQSLTLSPEGDELAPEKHVCDDDEDCNDCPESNTCERCVTVKEEDEVENKEDAANEDEDEAAV